LGLFLFLFFFPFSLPFLSLSLCAVREKEGGTGREAKGRKVKRETKTREGRKDMRGGGIWKGGQKEAGAVVASIVLS